MGANLGREIAQAWRRLARTPGATLVAALTLALGMATFSAVVTLADALAFNTSSSLGVADVFAVIPGRAQPRLALNTPGVGGVLNDAGTDAPPRLPFAVYEQLAADLPPDAATIVGDAGVWPLTIRMPGRADHVLAEFVSGGYADVFSVRTQVGRWLNTGDDRRVSSDPVVVISDRLWREWFGGRPDAIGRAQIHVQRLARPFTVIGVAPRGHRGLRLGFSSADVWMPLGAGVPLFDTLIRQRFGVATYVRAGRSGSRADLAGRIAAAAANGPGGSDVRLIPASEALSNPVLRRLGAGLGLVAGLVLAAACANLVNLLYARGAGRAGEMAVRLALGAPRTRIFRLFLIEPVLIGVIAAGIAEVLTLVAIRGFVSAFPHLLIESYPVALDLRPGAQAAVFSMGTGLAAALAAGVAVAWRLTRRSDPLRVTGAGVTWADSGRTRTILVAVQLTSALLLTLGAGLHVERARHLLDQRVTYDPRPIAFARVETDAAAGAVAPADAPAGGRAETARDTEALLRRIIAGARTLPGVTAAAAVDQLPGGLSDQKFFTITARPADGAAGPARRLTATHVSASPGLLDVLGLPLGRGRDIADSDTDGSALVVLVSQHAARALWPGVDPIGREIMLGNEGRWRTVVGTFADATAASHDERFTRQQDLIILPIAQRPSTSALMLIRSSAPESGIEALRALIAGSEPDVLVFGTSTIETSALGWTGPVKVILGLTAAMALVALAIALLGVHAVVAQIVARRMREFGIRVALGATPGQIRRLVLDHAVHLMLLGLLPGVLVASLTTRFLEASSLEVLPNALSTWAALLLLFVAAGVLAASVPARRASRSDPQILLRHL
jgi:predicted permease